MKLHFNL